MWQSRTKKRAQTLNVPVPILFLDSSFFFHFVYDIGVAASGPGALLIAMPGKKKGKGKKKKKKGGLVGPNTETFLDNYLYACSIFGEAPQSEFVEEVGSMVLGGTQLTKIEFGERDLNPLGMRCLIEGLMGTLLPVGAGEKREGTAMSGETFLNISEIRIWKSNVGDDGLAAVGKMLKRVEDKSFRLTTIDLMDNNIGPRGCQWLAYGLGPKGNKTVKILSLDHNPKIGDEGGKAICEGLLGNVSIEQLGLEYCGLGVPATRHLAQVIFSKATKLQTVRLMGNRIGRQGFVCLAMGLKRNTTVHILDLGDNEIGEYPPTDADRVALENIVDCLMDNNSLAALNLDLNFIGSSGYKLLDEEHRARMKPVLAKALVFASGMSPESVDIGEPAGGGGKKRGKKKGKKKKKK